LQEFKEEGHILERASLARPKGWRAGVDRVDFVDRVEVVEGERA
jgi:hypothetical protein